MRTVTGESTLRALAGIFAQAGARWAVIGAHAANHYRSAARMTQDIDILVGAPGRAIRAPIAGDQA